MAEHSVDLAAYFSRIGYAVPVAPTLDVLRAIQLRHVCSIPFENLDVLLGRGIALDLESVQAKLVTNRRGGYCFEQNWLLLHVLRQIGFEAMPLSARVRLDRPRDMVPPRTHVFVKVTLSAEQVGGAGGAEKAGDWLVDVGVGSMSPTAPFRMVENAEHPTPHETRRLVREPGVPAPRWFHQAKILRDGVETWIDICEFNGEEMHAIDREVGNWFTSTNPNSRFKQYIMASLANPDGTRYSLANGDFTHRRSSDGTVLASETITTPDRLREVLKERFGLEVEKGTVFGVGGL
jgi:N-hydroxyarylamine O-acetyltransferase